MILERLKQYIDAKGITIAAFEREAGMSNAAFGKALKNNGAIGTDKLENILSTYPDINPVWLLTGNGNMLTSGNPAATAPDAGRSVSPTTVPAGYGNLTYRVIRVNDNRLLYERATAPCLTNCRSKRSKLRQRIPKGRRMPRGNYRRSCAFRPG